MATQDQRQQSPTPGIDWKILRHFASGAFSSSGFPFSHETNLFASPAGRWRCKKEKAITKVCNCRLFHKDFTL